MKTSFGIASILIFILIGMVTVPAHATMVCYTSSGLLYPLDGSVTWTATVKFDLSSQADLMVTPDEFLAFDVVTVGDSYGLVGATYDLSEFRFDVADGFVFASSSLGAAVTGAINSGRYAYFDDTTTLQTFWILEDGVNETNGPSRGVNQTVVWEYVPCDEVPEPTTMALLGMGAAGLIAKRRRVV
ncbi:MAG: PEP-CTERM sorting domain-containing protein [Candidatus Omnitrophica bacterium]|nr:PEP-CTERM sorting domain-containing protein [Candidatus Omnitrophota bacterium]